LKEKETYNSSGNPTEVQTTSKKSPFFWFSVAKKNPKSKTDVTEFSKKKEKLVAESTKKNICQQVNKFLVDLLAKKLVFR